jgi:ABC transporter substrate binding protein
MQIRSDDGGENLSSQLMVGSPSFCEASHAPSVHAMITCRPERTPARRQPTRRSNEATKSYLRSFGRCRCGYHSCAAKGKRSSHCGRSSLTTLTETSFAPGICAIFTELRRLGYVEGKNILIERYSGEGRAPHYPDLARDVVRRNPDLIIAIGNDLVLDLKAAITTIPIVGTFGARVEAGIVSNLPRPGGNITGVSNTVGLEQSDKRVQLLRQVMPHATRFGCSNRESSETDSRRKNARVLGGMESSSLRRRSTVR